MASNDMSPLMSMSPTAELEHVCNLCNCNYEQPRVLSCLHLFCESCLDRLLLGEVGVKNVITCPECHQETKLNGKGVSGLPLDYVMCNQLDMSAFESMQIVCTSCKAKEKAVARCCDCSNFLCPNCVTAHKYMRCFENHKVVSFDDIKSSGDGLTIHKPITCSSHPEEYMKYYCYSCQVPICNECMVLDHKQPEHQYERASDAEEKQREELENLMAESKSKVQFCEEATNALQACLTELEQQRDNAKSIIQETFQSYKAILEKQQDSLLQQLNAMHSEQELHIMDTFHCVEKTIEKIEDACRFAERLLKHGNTIEVLSLKQVVGSQLLYLINNTPKTEMSVEIRFESNQEKFEDAVQQWFGRLRKVESPTKPSDSASPPQQASPLHSMSSFDSEGFALPAGVLSPDSPVPSTLDMDLSNVVTQYNLAQLVGMAEGSNSHGSPSPTPSAITLSDLLMQSSGQDIGVVAQLNALNNLTALAKLGSSNMNGEGHMSRSSASHSRSAPSTPQPISGRESSLMSPDSDIHTPHRMNSPDSLINGGNMGMALTRAGLGQFGYNPPPRSTTTKLNTMQIRCKFGQLGPGKGQFSSPHGFCLGMEEEIVVADTNNHRIQVFDKMGEFKFQFGIPGKEEGQLWYPRKVAIIRSSGKFVICDRGNERSRMQIFTKTGHFIRKVAIRYIDIVAGLAITSEGHIATVDSVTPTVFILSESGDVLRWFDCSGYMREPSDLAIIGKEYYICDFKGHCVIVLSEQGQFLRRIGCENLTNFPNGIDISDAGDVLVGDSHGNRFHVVVFSREGSVLSEFECPYVKVSRCCGLKITSEGYIVTLAKNNHHVLVLNTLYIM